MGSYRNKQHTKEYDDYLKSEAWQHKRDLRLKIDDYSCAMCGRPQEKCKRGLTVHHIRYYRNGHSILGRENVWKDLVSLCYPCHHKLHRYYGRKQ